MSALSPMYRWTVTILVAAVILFGAGLALRAAASDDVSRPPAPQQHTGGSGGGRLSFY